MLLDKIRQAFPQLTKSQKSLAEFVTANYREAAFMTASGIARRIGLNEATVIRFAQRIGYPGFPEFLHDLQAIVREELSVGSADSATGDGDSWHTLVQGQVEALQRTMTHIPSEAWDSAVTMLRGAARIVVLGQGLAAPLAGLLAWAWRTIGIDAQCPSSDTLSVALMVDQLGAGDALVGISVALPSPEVAHALALARAKGIPTVVLSASPVSHCARAAEVALSWPVDPGHLMPSLTPVVILIDALVLALASSSGATTDERLIRISALESVIRTGTSPGGD